MDLRGGGLWRLCWILISIPDLSSHTWAVEIHVSKISGTDLNSPIATGTQHWVRRKISHYPELTSSRHLSCTGYRTAAWPGCSCARSYWATKQFSRRISAVQNPKLRACDLHSLLGEILPINHTWEFLSLQGRQRMQRYWSVANAKDFVANLFLTFDEC